MRDIVNWTSLGTQQTLMVNILMQITTTLSLHHYWFCPISKKDWFINQWCFLFILITKSDMNDSLSKLWCFGKKRRLLQVGLPSPKLAYCSQVHIGWESHCWTKQKGHKQQRKELYYVKTFRRQCQSRWLADKVFETGQWQQGWPMIINKVKKLGEKEKNKNKCKGSCLQQ